MAAALILVLILGVVLPAQAAGSNATKQSTSRDIAIVFDNSGSMYVGSQPWCPAIYSMEVFASMLNEGDTLRIYPMYEIETRGASYTMDDPLIVRGGEDTSVIRDIYTPHAGDTPIESIMAAHRGLSGSTADAQYLIVLTDGAEFYENEASLGNRTRERLSELLSEYVQSEHVYYLAIGSQTAMPEVASTGGHDYYSETAQTSQEVLAKLTLMCNRIFARDLLPTSNFAGQDVHFDVSMRRLIVFLQGSDVSNVKLLSAGGQSVPGSSPYMPRYSERGAGSYTATPDTGLSGVVVSFDQLDAGNYQLSYDGTATSSAIYYEPDVSLDAILTDAEGQPVDTAGPVYPGEYTLHYGLVDRDGQLTDSSLLGNTHYTFSYGQNGEAKTSEADRSGELPFILQQGDVIDDVKLEATFLSGYYAVKTGEDLGWGFLGQEITPEPAGELRLTLDGPADSALSELEGKTLGTDLLYRGEPLTEEARARAELQVMTDVEGIDAVFEGGSQPQIRMTVSGAPERLPEAVKVTAVASFIDDNGQQAVSAPAEWTIRLTDDRFGLGMRLEGGEDYYRTGEIQRGSAESFTAPLFKAEDHTPFTDEELAGLTVTAVAEGPKGERIQLIPEPIPGQSAYRLRFPEKAPVSGKYKLHVRAEGVDDLGQPLQAEARENFRVSPLPRWLIPVIILAGLLLIALIIWIIMNQKVLPKRIDVEKTVFTVDGEKITGNAGIKFDGGGKRSGRITIQSPKYIANPNVKGGLTLQLEAVDPRRIPSGRRAAGVKSATAMNSATVQTMRISTASYVKDEETGKMVRAGKRGGEDQSYNITSGVRCIVTAEVPDGTGSEVSMTLNVTLHFS